MTPDLTDAAARNLATHATWVQARATGMRARVDERLAMGDSGLPTDSFSLVCGARLDVGSAATEVAEAIAWYEGRPFSWWCVPGDRPASLPSLLMEAGLEPAEEETAMACDLSALDHAGPRPEGLAIARVTTPADLERFAGLLAGLADPPDRALVEFYRIAAPHLLTDDCPLRLYLGSRGGHAVATAELTLAGGVAGLYNVSTLAAERRQGIGTAMTLAPLLEARREGVRYGVLQAATEGVGVYERVGFVATGRIREFKPPASSAAWR